MIAKQSVIKLFIASMAMFALFGVSNAQKTKFEILPENWQSSHFSDNPLIGKIYKGSGKQSRADVLLLQAQLTRFVLLGEQHDNPDHHIIQANLLSGLTSKERKPRVVLEMVPQSLEAELQTFDLNTDPKLEDFAQRLKWEERGWYSWEIYRPIALAAIKNSLPMFAGNLDRTKTRALSKQGLKALSPSEVQDYGLNEELSASATQTLLRDLEGAHCGMMPKTALPSMLTVQRARDGAMAQAMIRSGGRFGAVLISGNGHVRKDVGVPLVLRKKLPGTREMKVAKSADGQDIMVRVPNAHTLSIGLIEVQDGKEQFTDYSLTNDAGQPLYDHVIFTPKFDITDHCAAMREQFKTMKKNKKVKQ